MLSVRAVTAYDDFLNIKGTWDSLLLKGRIQNPYLKHDWFRIAYNYFENHHDLFILIVLADQETIAIAPLIISQEKYLGISLKKLRFLENVHTPFQDCITNSRKQEAITVIVDFLQTNTHLWDIFELREIKENSDTLPLLEELCQQRNIFQLRFLQSSSWSVPTNIPYEDGLAKLQSRVKKEFRRKLGRLENLGQLSFKVITNSEETEKHLQLFFKFYEQSWKGKEQNSNFYYKIASAFCRNNEFRLFTLCLDQKPIAYVFALKAGKMLFGLKTTFDPFYCAFSPGSVMFYKIFEYCFLDADIDLFDFGRGNERYKQEFASISTNQVNLVGAHKKTIVSYLFFIRFKIVLYIKKKKYFNAILNLFLKNLDFFREMPVLIKTKFFKSARQNIPTFYIKKIKPVNDELEGNGICGKYAGPDDLDNLAVVSKAKRFTDLTERLEKEKCFLIMKDKKIEHYFWFSNNKLAFKPLNVKDTQLLLTEYDLSFSQLEKTLALKIFDILCADLALKKFDSLIISSCHNDFKKREFIESLGFIKMMIKLMN